MSNERFDYIDDFPLSAAALESHIDRLYGSNRNAVRYHVKDGLVVNSDVVGAGAVTNAEYEYQLNERKARIKLIKPSLLQQILREYDGAFTKGIVPIVA